MKKFYVEYFGTNISDNHEYMLLSIAKNLMYTEDSSFFDYIENERESEIFLKAFTEGVITGVKFHDDLNWRIFHRWIAEGKIQMTGDDEDGDVCA